MNTAIFEPIKLEEMEQVKLMNRTDRKYWFHTSKLAAILQEIKFDYFLLNIDGESALPYSSVYYDTTANTMYTAHHNGKLNRYKIRKRTYVSSGISFLEVKFKNNKGRTIKKRIPAELGKTHFSVDETEFVNRITPFLSTELKPTLVNEFTRLTLVNKNFSERCTIDLNLKYTAAGQRILLEDIVIVEIKAAGNSGISPLALALRNARIKTSGMSKYCIGRSLTNPLLKRNTFKEKLRKIEKEIYINYN